MGCGNSKIHSVERATHTHNEELVLLELQLAYALGGFSDLVYFEQLTDLKKLFEDETVLCDALKDVHINSLSVYGEEKKNKAIICKVLMKTQALSNFIVAPDNAATEVTVVSIRGSSTPEEAKQDAQSAFYKDLKDESKSSLGKVSEGFLNAYLYLKEKNLLLDAIKSAKETSGMIVLCGHSLGISNIQNYFPKLHILFKGGAVATILTHEMYIKCGNELKMALFTYGSPRVFDKETADKVAAYPFPHYRIVNHGDLVPILPGRSIGRAHCKQPHFYKTRVNSKFLLSNDVDYDGAEISECKYSITYHMLAAENGYLRRIKKTIDRLVNVDQTSY